MTIVRNFQRWNQVEPRITVDLALETDLLTVIALFDVYQSFVISDISLFDVLEITIQL